jgi:hypothetical protein
MPIEIVKVQRPVAQSPGEPVWLIYDKSRRHEVMLPERAILQSVKKAMGNDLKAHFKAAWSSVVGWGISERVPNQDW